MMRDLIRGGGGGGGSKGGGKKQRAPVEAADSLRSRQYARVIDLVSEGEIGGLADGMKSVYLDNTPLQNPDGSFNFNDVTIIERPGTQSQAYVPGFSAAEAETAVNAEVTHAASVTRTISNTNTNAVRVTVSVPQLTSQNTSIDGASVEIAIDVQNNGGGFVAQSLRSVTDRSKFSVTSPGGVMLQDSSVVSVDVRWTGLLIVTRLYFDETVDTTQQNCNMSLQYRVAGSGGAWTTAQSFTFAGKPTQSQPNPFQPPIWVAPTADKTFSLSLASDSYEFRVVKNSGTGLAAIVGGSVYVPSYTDVISGKTTSKYQRAYRIDLPTGGPWEIRVRRITADSGSATLQNATWWDSLTELIEAKLRYPNSALVAVEVNSEQFSNIPVRSYDCYGLLVQIPDNYDPITRVYTGTWSGNFVTAWTDNPAWVFYDLIVNDRYGLGEFISASQVDKWSLYSIAQYCDELVEDGFGGMEPRFTCFLYLQSQEEAYTVLANVASIFRAYSYWAGGSMVAVQDSPSDPVALFTPANVVDGEFVYQGSGRGTRHTVALVAWNDPDDAYRQKIEYVADEAGIARYGVQQTDIVAIGCKSRGQAHRAGRAILYSERMETESVQFRTGLIDATVFPGAIIHTHDPVRAGVRFGGRVQSATTTAITLDGAVTIESGKTYELSCILPDGSVESRAVTNGAGSATVLTLATALSDTPLNYSMWVLAANDLLPESWRVVGVTEVDKVNAEITAISYRPDKYDAIETGLVLEPLPNSNLNASAPDTPIGMTVTESLYLTGLGTVGVKAVVGWQAVSSASYYLLDYRKAEGNAVTVELFSNSHDIQPIEEGDYVFSLVAVNALGRRSQPFVMDVTIHGKQSPPADVENLQLNAITGMAFVSFNPATDLDVLVGGYLRMRHSSLTTGATWNDSVDIGAQVPGNATSVVLPLLEGTYLAKWFDSTGNQSENAVSIITNAPSVMSMNAIELIEEHPAWAGTMTDVSYDPSFGGIKLGGTTLIDDMTDLIDDWPLIDSLGGLQPDGEYLFFNDVDLGAVVTSRLTATLETQSFDEFDLIDDRAELIDDWLSFDGDLITDTSAVLYVRTTNDNPAGSPVWSSWAPFFVGDYTARAFQFKVVMATLSSTHNIVVTALSVAVDMPDIIDSAENIVSGAATKSVTFNLTFKALKGLAITAENMATGDYYTISNKTTSGFDILFKNSGGSNVSRTFDYIARGY